MNLKTVTIADLKPHPDNPNTHPTKQIDALAESLTKFTQVKNVVIWNDRIIAGHGIIEAAKKAAILTLEAQDISHWPEDKATEFMLTDIRTPGMAIVDDQALVEALRAIDEPLDIPGFDEDFLAGLPGFEPAPPPEPPAAQVDKVAELQKIWQVKVGDVWKLGRHRIACIDSLDEGAVKALIGEDVVGMVWADPPYGINAVDTNRGTINSGNPYPFGGLKNKVTGTIGSGNLIPANRYAPIIGDETGETARKATTKFLSLFPDALHIWWGANHYSDVLPASSCWIIWDKKDDLPSNDFSDGEMAWVKSGLAVRIFRHRWSGLVKASEQGQRRVHPTQKPVALFEWAANKYFKQSGIVFDPFLGSGISVIGAENIGDQITVIGCELSPEYIAVICQRFLDHTGIQPELIK